MSHCQSLEYLKGTAEDRERYKASIARTMMLWLIQSRHDLREAIDGQADSCHEDDWGATGIRGALGDDEFERTVQRINEFSSADLSDEEHSSLDRGLDEHRLIGFAASANILVDKHLWWPRPCCPISPIIRAMLNAALAFVDDYWVLEEN